MDRQERLNAALDFIRSNKKSFEETYELWCRQDRTICEDKFRQLYEHAGATDAPYVMDWAEAAWHWLFGDPGPQDDWVEL